MFNEIVGRTKYFLTNTDGFKWVMPFFRRTGLLHLWHLFVRGPVDRFKNRIERKEFVDFCEQHAGDFSKLNDMLEDDFSRKTMRQVIEFRKTWHMRDLKGIICKNQYFQEDIFGPVQNEVFIDGGAYSGDTIKALIRNFGKGENYCKRIFAWEPDEANVRLMNKNLAEYKNLTIIREGMWQEKTELTFASGGGSCSKISDDGDIRVSVDSIDHLCSGETVTFIKMDIEGSEQAALKGAEMVIRRDRPRLAICIYHSWEDLYEIAFWIKKTVPEYRLYVRHHSDNAAETVLYATL